MLYDLNMSYDERAEKALNPAAKELFNLMENKKTNLALANDEMDQKKFLDLADRIGPEMAVLKTHIDILRDFSPETVKKLLELKKKHNFIIFEDRKFADIGNTVALQYSEGIYKIADWANLVNIHIVPGPGIIQGIGDVMKKKNDGISRGILILAQMSSAGNLATGAYTKKAVEFANQNKELVAGFIGNGGDLKTLSKLVNIAFEGQLIFTPGIQIQTKGDSMGQQYSLPKEAVLAGSDCMIVGRGIYKLAENSVEMAKQYRKEGWEAYMERTEE